MQMIRTLSVSVAALSLSTAALAQFDGPAPLAWRWMQNSRILTGAPVVDGDMVYVAAGQRIYALDKDSGNQRWKYPNVDPIPGYFKGQPLLVDNLVIAAADNKTLYAVDKTTHDIKWSYVAPTPIAGEPVLAGKYVAMKLGDNSIMAVATEDGKPAWETPTRFLIGLIGQIAAYQNNILVFTDDYKLHSISITNPQKPVWSKPFGAISPDAAPLVFGDTIYVTSGSFLAALNGATGTPRWQTPVSEEIALPPAVSARGILAVTRDRHAFLLGLDGRLDRKTRFELPSDGLARPSAVGDFYIVPTANGGINLLNPATGEIVWNYLIRPVGEFVVGSTGNSGNNANQSPTKILTIQAAGPVVVDGTTLLVMARDGSLLAFDKNLGVDLTPPSVNMTWPVAGDVVSGQPPLVLAFKIEDEATGVNPKTLKIDVDGAQQDYEFTRDGAVIVSISQSGKNRPLLDGRRSIHVTVSDWIGNVANQTFTLNIDNTLRPLSAPPIDRGGTGGGGPQGGGGPRGGGSGGR